ncbi:response regulator [Fulvivirga lutimaris]|uniref:response regulator n=1 Tax=Fulvivirga lutimaris TaxID=1819566 RepID=UPI0012BC67DD|nr:response regulator [Fulvivirga lutimaris]MTI41555.1 response regulator [Fulvivirga lutimaris]
MPDKRILVVEDNAIIAFSYIAFLQAEGFEQIKHISKGAMVYDAVVEFNPDFIMMNFILADDINGIDAAKTIRKSFQTPIIFISGSNDLDVKISNSYFFNKPLDFTALSKTIKEILALDK